MKKIILALSVIAYFASCSSNTDSTNESENQDSTAVETGVSGSYNIDLSSSYVNWEGAHLVGSVHNGQVKINEGSFEVENGQVTSGEIIINLATISALDLTGKPEDSTKLTKHLKNPDFFHIDSFPFASYEITGSTNEGNNTIISGNLTIKGVSKPVSFNSQVSADANGFKATGETEIDRTEWGLTFGSKNYFENLAADKVVKDKIKIGFNISANPK